VLPPEQFNKNTGDDINYNSNDDETNNNNNARIDLEDRAALKGEIWNY
jgi:hypothetical protein